MIMPFAGFVVWKGELTLVGVALVGTAGCLAGSLVATPLGHTAVCPSLSDMANTC
jgi:membrane protein DedA with SNARE-associated domain